MYFIFYFFFWKSIKNIIFYFIFFQSIEFFYCCFKKCANFFFSALWSETWYTVHGMLGYIASRPQNIAWVILGNMTLCLLENQVYLTCLTFLMWTTAPCYITTVRVSGVEWLTATWWLKNKVSSTIKHVSTCVKLQF